MIFGFVEIGDGVCHTHNDSYALNPNTTFSAPRPFRAAGTLTAGLITAFGAAFSDLLLWHELGLIAVCAASSVLLGHSIAHLRIINSDLRGSDMTVAAWGTYWHLNRIRRDLANSVRGKNVGGRS